MIEFDARGKLPDDEVGRSWVNCPKHGVTNCAMRHGLDQRCAKCVSNLLAAVTPCTPAPFPRPRRGIAGSMIFLVFDRKKLNEALENNAKIFSKEYGEPAEDGA